MPLADKIWPRERRRRVPLIVATALLAGGARIVAAQGPPVTRELRLDAIESTHLTLQAGASVIVPSGVYARTALTAATGITSRDGREFSSTRVEAISRFLLDPFRESPYGLSVGGGAGVTNAAGGPHWKPYVALLLDLELKRTGGWTPAIQLGIGGGTRVGVVLRSGADRWR
jgi:hypothetical protein